MQIDMEPQVENAVDSVCALGCELVSAYIRALEKGEERGEYALLDSPQHACLLHELQAIMSVYDSRV